LGDSLRDLRDDEFEEDAERARRLDRRGIREQPIGLLGRLALDPVAAFEPHVLRIMPMCAIAGILASTSARICGTRGCRLPVLRHARRRR